MGQLFYENELAKNISKTQHFSQKNNIHESEKSVYIEYGNGNCGSAEGGRKKQNPGKYGIEISFKRGRDRNTIPGEELRWKRMNIEAGSDTQITAGFTLQKTILTEVYCS